jgi:hypothetical protein
MKSLNLKLALSALGIVAALSSPAFAKKAPHVTRDNPAATYQTIPGYDASGSTVAIPDPDQR